MNQELNKLLQDKQKFVQTALKYLQQGNHDRAIFFMNLDSAVDNKIVEVIEKMKG